MNLSRQTRARLAWAVSLFKPRWQFSDYPLDYIDQGECSPDLPERLQHKRWRADLINWYEMSGTGESKEAALKDAQQKFTAWQVSGKKLCRPGTLPGKFMPGSPKVIFPEDQQIDNYAELRDDFITQVLQLPWAWITDESSLWDFHTKNDNSDLYLKIGEIYGVDVSHISSAKLLDIFAEILNQVHTFPEDSVHKAIRLGRDARDRHNMGLPEEPWNPYL